MNQMTTANEGRIRVSKAEGTWVVRADGAVIAESRNAVDLSETGYPSVIYFPRGDVAMAFLEPTGSGTTSPGKGAASWFSVVTSAKTLPDAAWSYESPKAGLERIAGHIAFYATDDVAVERL